MLNKIAELINKNVPGANATVHTPADTKCDGSVTVDGTQIYKVCEFLRDNKEMPFNALQTISGVDYVEYLEVCYMLAHFDVNDPREFILKVKLTDRLNPNLDSIVKIYAAANFQERECYDMIGVSFNNHPDHRRILCPDDWEGYPLRKDYVAAKFYNGMEVNPNMKMNFDDREYVVRQDMIKKAQKAASTDAQ